jgi:hypothetical protein
MDRTSLRAHLDAKIASIQVVGLSALLGGFERPKKGADRPERLRFAVTIART